MVCAVLCLLESRSRFLQRDHHQHPTVRGALCDGGRCAMHHAKRKRERCAMALEAVLHEGRYAVAMVPREGTARRRCVKHVVRGTLRDDAAKDTARERYVRALR